MTEYEDQLIEEIIEARPTNEAEVETKILLHLFRLLGFTDRDRADKPTIRMFFGRELKEKIADFILYDGLDRSATNALVAVEAKRPGQSLTGAEKQVLSYATWAGTPFYVACNGRSLLVSLVVPGTHHPRSGQFEISALHTALPQLRNWISRSNCVLEKERLGYLAAYLPCVENLPPSTFYKEYLVRLRERFAPCSVPPPPMQVQESAVSVLPHIPVTLVDAARDSFSETDIADALEAGSRILLTGAPGSGKTTFCCRLAYALAGRALESEGRLLPVYLRLSRGFPASAAACLTAAYRDIGLQAFPSLFEKTLQGCQLVLILDGLDEYVRWEGDAKEDLERRALFADAAVLVSSRPEVLDRKLSQAFLHTFQQMLVRPLLDVELEEVLARHLREPAHRSELLRRAQSGEIGDLRSPMLALMAICIANADPQWHLRTPYALYTRHIEVLNDYFNHRAVRGTGTPPSIDALVALIGEAALALRREACSLSALCDLLKLKHGPDPVVALLNCGILTTAGGRASFVHASFMDFGLAAMLLRNLRSSGPEGLVIAGATADSYRLAATDCSAADQALLLGAITHANKYVRKGAVGILSHVLSGEVLEAFWHALPNERAPKLLGRMLRTLVRAKHEPTRNWVLSQWGQLPERTRWEVSKAVRAACDHLYLDEMLRLATHSKTAMALECLFSFALYGELSDETTERLRKVFFACPASARARLVISLPRVIRRRYSERMRKLACVLLREEESILVLLLLLLLVQPAWHLLAPSVASRVAFLVGACNLPIRGDLVNAVVTMAESLRSRARPEDLVLADAIVTLVNRQTS